ncbi:proteasome subunit beta type [Gregarina niphandrodes]|uniref:Proteasome subunit beta n=1 Tax=Gregarina niphandrodes TaxID=110365 RepID=A0A023B5N8_GRENI|nr:proteasome subunit beta type [Gregarina niphandrodes]EZG60243.1 proteasome subunit beta type [Gregarina niphandrodes]|eukprot:XP_011130846.1 proteasome subunit beta type [Gregarina niphandrodes]
MEFQLLPQDPKPQVRTLNPTFVGSSVLAVKYRDGVLMGTDTLISAGHSGREFSKERLVKIGDRCVIACSGDHADLQHLGEYLQSVHLKDEMMGDDITKSAEEYHSLLSRMIYNQRNKMNPYWTNMVVIGDGNNGKDFFLGSCDMWATSLKEDLWTTGLGHYFSVPHLRNVKDVKEMSLEEAKELLIKCFKINSKYDCFSSEEIQFAYVNATGTHIETPLRASPRM